jgi:hypothetical protein
MKEAVEVFRPKDSKDLVEQNEFQYDFGIQPKNPEAKGPKKPESEQTISSMID